MDTVPPRNNRSYFPLILILIALLAASVIWNIVGLVDRQGSSSTPGANDALYDSQNAIINGTITTVEGKSITVKNKREVTGTIMAGENITITDMDNPGAVATPSADLSKIQLNKEATIHLMVVNGEYVVQAINFMPNTPPAPVVPSDSSVPAPVAPSPAPQRSGSPVPAAAAPTAPSPAASPADSNDEDN